MTTKTNTTRLAFVNAAVNFAQCNVALDKASADFANAAKLLADTAKALRQAKITIEARASKGTLALQLRDALAKTGLAKGTVANYLTAMRRYVNEGGRFNLNPSRGDTKATKADKVTKPGTKASKAKVIKPLAISTGINKVLDTVAESTKEIVTLIENHREALLKHDPRVLEYLDYLSTMQG